MCDETWKPVVGYEWYYEVSDEGNVRTVGRYINSRTFRDSRMLKKKITKNGYESVGLRKDGKTKRLGVHRLVAQAFIPNPFGKSEVNHIDGNKRNNAVSNLEWVSRSENMVHSVRMHEAMGKKRKLTKDQIRLIRNDGRKHSEIAEEYGVSRSVISGVKLGTSYRDLIRELLEED